MPTLQADIGYAGAYPVGEGETVTGHRVLADFATGGALPLYGGGTIATVIVAVPGMAGARQPHPFPAPSGTGIVLQAPKVRAGAYVMGKGPVTTGFRLVANVGRAGAFGETATLVNVGIVVRPTGAALAGAIARDGLIIIGTSPPPPPPPDDAPVVPNLPPSDIIQSTSLEITPGLELLATDDTLIADISDDLLSGVVSRNNDADIHGTCRLRISRTLNWHNQRLRPYLTLTDLTTGASARFDLGIYLPETPTRVTGESVATFDVEGYDKLVLLDTPHGIAYTVPAETRILDAVQGLLEERGFTHSLDPTSSTVALAARSWPLDERNTTLRIINELLSSISYTPLFVDRTGAFCSKPALPLEGQAPVWHYDTTSPRTIVGQEVSEEIDLFAIPNRWIFVRDDPAQAAPVEGDGIYTVLNATDGPTSIAERGRVITRLVRLDAADQTALIAQGNAIVRDDRQPLAIMRFTGVPNPLHWHDDAITFTAPELGLEAVSFGEQSWSLPLDGSDMTHVVRRTVSV